MDWTIFTPELNMITNDNIKTFTIEVLKLAPKYFWDVPSSVSGKYHPYCNNGKYGLIMHTKLCVNAGEEIFENSLLIASLTNKKGLSNIDKDICISSILIHDIHKYGTDDILEIGTKSRKDHPLLAGALLKSEDSLNNIVSEDIKEKIVKCVERHTGPWTKDRNGNTILDEPSSSLEKIVHLMDYFGSRKTLMNASLDRFFANNDLPHKSNVNMISTK